MTPARLLAGWKRAAEGGDAEAAWALGDAYENGETFAEGRRVEVRRDREEAIRWFRVAAGLGNTEAMGCLGTLLTDSERAEDVVEGIAWLKRAHRRGDSCAAHNLAVTYSELGNRKRCAAWLKKSLGNREGRALFLLGIAYAAGYGVRKDLAEAARLFRKVARGKNEFPCEREEARGFLKMIEQGRLIRVEGSIGRVHPEG